MRARLLSLGAVGLGAVVLTIADRQKFFAKHGAAVELVAVAGTQIPDMTAATPMGYIGAPAALMRAASGAKIKILASFDSARLTGGLIVSPGINGPDDMRGKRLGARVRGAALWLHTVLALEKLGLDPDRENIEIAEVGDPAQIVAALAHGQIDGAVLPRAQCEQLEAMGFKVLLDFAPLSVHGCPDALVVLDDFLAQSEQPIAIVAAMIEAAAFALSERNREQALLAVKSTLGIFEDGAAEKGLGELAATLVRKPYPSIERLRNMQRMMATARPNVVSLNIDNVVDGRLVQKLDAAGYIDQTYSSYAV